MAQIFSREELEDIRDRAFELALEWESDAGLRAALQLLGESAGNLIPKLPPKE